MPELEINTTASASIVVQTSDLASALQIDDDKFPPVLATARMVALMEVAAARVLKPLLGPGELSVGVSVDVVHAAPTPVGASVVATATFTGREGKLFVFQVVASDDAGEVGRGTHKRAIVSTERIVSGAARRARSA